MASKNEVDSFFSRLEEKNLEEMKKTETRAMQEILSPEKEPEAAPEVKAPETETEAEEPSQPKSTKPASGKKKQKEPEEKGPNVKQVLSLTPEVRKGIKQMALDKDCTISELISGWYWEHAKKAARKSAGEAED